MENHSMSTVLLLASLMISCTMGLQLPRLRGRSKEFHDPTYSLLAMDMVRNKPSMGDWGFNVSGMDLSVAPGKNFYWYAAGKYMSQLDIPADETSWGQFDILNELTMTQLRTVLEDDAKAGKKTGKFYASYMNEKLIEHLDVSPFKPTLERIKQIRNKVDLAKMAGESASSFMPSPFDFDIMPDDMDPDKYCVMLDQGGLGLPQEYYTEAQFADKKAAYKKHIAKMLSFIGWPHWVQASEDILALEERIANVSWTAAQMRDPMAVYNPMTIQELQSKTPGFDFNALFRSAGLDPDFQDNVPSSRKPVPHGVKLVVGAVGGVVAIADIIGKTDLHVLKSWAAFSALRNCASSLSSRFVNEVFDFWARQLEGQEQIGPRWKRGVSRLNGFMGEAVGKSYVEKHFPEESKRAMEGLTLELKAAFRQRMEHVSWMSDATKKKALAKLDSFDIQVGYPNKWRNYDSLHIDEADYFGNVERSLLFDWDYSLGMLGRPVDRDEWAMAPQEVNAYNMLNMNQVVFPAAILQPPFFDLAADMAVNYGAIGAVIGHEMTHGFDDQGHLYDKTGRLNSWWTDHEAKVFEELTESYSKQFAAFTQGLPEGAHIDPQLTMGECIADLGGVNIALQAYHNSLKGSPKSASDPLQGDRRFFLGFAQVWAGKSRPDATRAQLVSDPHPPAVARVNVPTSNIDDWYKAFHVTGGEHFLPHEQRVVVW